MKSIKKAKIKNKNGIVTVEVLLPTFEETDFHAKRVDVGAVRSYLENKGYKVTNGEGPLLTNYNNKIEGTFTFDLVEGKKSTKKATKKTTKSDDYLEAAYAKTTSTTSKKNKK